MVVHVLKRFVLLSAGSSVARVVKTFFNHLGHKKKDRKKNGRQRAVSEGKAGIAACSGEFPFYQVRITAQRLT